MTSGESVFNLDVTIKVGVRGFPNGIFNPWVRWNTWPGLGQEFFRRRRRHRRRPPEFTTGHRTGARILLQDTKH